MNKPFLNLRDASVEVTVWKNQNADKMYYSINFSNSYKDDNDQWCKSQNFSPVETLQLTRLIERAYDAINADKSAK